MDGIQAKVQLTDGKTSNLTEVDLNLIAPTNDVKAGTFFELKWQKSTGTARISRR